MCQSNARCRGLARAEGRHVVRGYTMVKAQFANRRHVLTLAAARQALGDGCLPRTTRWNHLR